MKKSLLHIIFAFLITSIFGQTQLLSEYDFDKGGYYILGQFYGADPHPLTDSIGEFYSNDITILNKLKHDWIFYKPLEFTSFCAYDYEIFICREGKILTSFAVNLDCEEIVTRKGSFDFNARLLRPFYGKLKKLYIKEHSFTTVQEARSFRKSILNAPTLIMTSAPAWINEENSGSVKWNPSDLTLRTYWTVKK